MTCLGAGGVLLFCCFGVSYWAAFGEHLMGRVCLACFFPDVGLFGLLLEVTSNVLET